MAKEIGNFRRVCAEDGCELEAAYRKQRCYECDMNRQPPVIRAEAAERRLSLIPPSARLKSVPKDEWPEGRRFCAGCQSFVRLKDCTGSRCKACVSISAHTSRTKATFGIDRDTYDWLFKLQGGRCAICRTRPRTKRLAVDHDHKHCKKGCQKCVRGLLCGTCNHELLSAARESVLILQNAVRYLETPPWLGDWEIPQVERTEWAAANPGEPPPPY